MKISLTDTAEREGRRQKRKIGVAGSVNGGEGKSESHEDRGKEGN